MDAKAFTRWTRDVTRGMSKDGAAKALNGIALKFTTRVILRNPVDTGRSRGGWTPYLKRVNEPSAGLVATDSGERFSTAEVARGRAEGSVSFDLTGPRQAITITNAVPYITELEFGSSDQAQAGMVRIVIRELRAGSTFTKGLRDEVEDQIKKANRRSRGV